MIDPNEHWENFAQKVFSESRMITKARSTATGMKMVKAICDGCLVNEGIEHFCQKNDALFNGKPEHTTLYILPPEAKIHDNIEKLGQLHILGDVSKILIRQGCECTCSLQQIFPTPTPSETPA